MRLNNSDLALIRDSKSHYTDLYMSIFQPDTVLQCQVNDISIAKGARTIAYDNVTAGSWQNVRTGATLLIGSSVGARDVGKVRIRSITSSQIVVAENSHIQWGDNLYLTVLDFIELWPIYPRIIQDPANPESTLWYKDYDIPYTNQNDNLGAFLNIGPHRAGFIENGVASFYFSASGTTPLSGAISQIQWTFQGGNPASYIGTTPGYVDWDTPGNYVMQCDVSGTNGWVETAYRYIRPHDKPSEGVDVPVLKWEITSIQGSRAEGGYTCSVTVYEDVEVQEGSIVILFADEWYDGTRKSLGGNAPNASNIKFVGYVLDNSIRYDYKDSSVSFEMGSITEPLKKMEGFAIELQSKGGPSQWYEMADINAKKAIYHYLKWHSTVIQLADIEFRGNDYLVQFFDSDRESLFDSIDNFMRGAYHGSVVSDRQGKIYLETDAWVQNNATGTFNPIFTLSKYDWIGQVNVKERRYPERSYLEYNGIAYSGVSTGTFAPLEACAPGSAPGYRGGSKKLPGFALGGQDHLNQIVGNDYFHENYPYPQIDTQMRGNWSNLDIAPQEAVQMDISSSDTVRGEEIKDLRMVSSITWDINSKNKTFIPRITWDAITTGPNGETIVIPEIVDGGGYGGGTRGGGIPTIIPPTIPAVASYYAALKLETNGGVAKAIPSGQSVNLPLTHIEFSSDGLPAGTASGTWSGAIIVPAVGASGTYGFNYGFLTTLPGIYRVGFRADILQSSPASPSWIKLEGAIGSNTSTPGLVSDSFSLVYDPSSGLEASIVGETILKMPANGRIWIVITNYASTTKVLDRGKAFVEFLKYEP